MLKFWKILDARINVKYYRLQVANVILKVLPSRNVTKPQDTVFACWVSEVKSVIDVLEDFWDKCLDVLLAASASTIGI